MKSALPVLDALPPGVTVSKRYPSYALVQCSHAADQQRPTGGWVVFENGEPDEAISRGRSEREVRAMLGPDQTLDYGGSMRCMFCGGDEWTTETFRRPVKRLVILTGAAAKAKLGEPLPHQETLL